MKQNVFSLTKAKNLANEILYYFRLVLFFEVLLYVQKIKKSYFRLKITFLGPKIQILIWSMAIFLLIVVHYIVNWVFWTSISSFKTTNICFSLAKDQKMTNKQAHQSTAFIWYVAIFGKFRAEYNKYGLFWRVALIFY